MIILFPVEGTRFREWRELMDRETSRWSYWDEEKSAPFDEKGKEIATEMMTRSIRNALMSGSNKTYSIKVNIPVFEEGWQMRYKWPGSKVVG